MIIERARGVVAVSAFVIPKRHQECQQLAQPMVL
jgi:hypothetical protein